MMQLRLAVCHISLSRDLVQPPWTAQQLAHGAKLTPSAVMLLQSSRHSSEELWRRESPREYVRKRAQDEPEMSHTCTAACENGAHEKPAVVIRDGGGFGIGWETRTEPPFQQIAGA